MAPPRSGAAAREGRVVLAVCLDLDLPAKMAAVALDSPLAYRHWPLRAVQASLAAAAPLSLAMADRLRPTRARAAQQAATAAPVELITRGARARVGAI